MSVLHYRIGIYMMVKMFRTLRKLKIASQEDYLRARQEYVNKYSEHGGREL